MPKKLLRILGINPGARYLGFALFYGHELHDWGVKVVKGRWSREKMKRIMMVASFLIEHYAPNIMAVKKLHPSRSSLNLKRLVVKIKGLSKRKRLKVCQYSIRELEAFLSPEEKISRERVAEIVAQKYPELFPELKKEKSHKNLYHLRMFEAVALGSTCFHQLDK
jgi:Holliday junction resolvasome RuvABC endonuclease subunit